MSLPHSMTTLTLRVPVTDPGSRGCHGPPSPVRVSHKKDGHQRRPYRFHVSRPPPYLAAGSATEFIYISACKSESDIVRN